MLKNKKVLLFLIPTFIILYLVISIVNNVSFGKKYKNTVFLGSSTKVGVQGNKIIIYNEDREISKQKCKIYFKNKYVDGYVFSGKANSSGIENVIAAVDKNGNDLLPKGAIIAHTPDISIDIKDGESYDSKDLTEFRSFAELNGIMNSELDELDYQEITKIDTDIDGEEENIYSIGLIKYNEDEEDDSNNKYESYVFLKKDGKYFIIDRIDSDGEQVSYIKLSFTKLIDFNKDGNYEFVVEKSMSEYGPYYYELYNFDGSKFTKIGGE